jgi:hypothetical protein
MTPGGTEISVTFRPRTGLGTKTFKRGAPVQKLEFE